MLCEDVETLSHTTSTAIGRAFTDRFQQLSPSSRAKVRHRFSQSDPVLPVTRGTATCAWFEALFQAHAAAEVDSKEKRPPSPVENEACEADTTVEGGGGPRNRRKKKGRSRGKKAGGYARGLSAAHMLMAELAGGQVGCNEGDAHIASRLTGSPSSKCDGECAGMAKWLKDPSSQRQQTGAEAVQTEAPGVEVGHKEAYKDAEGSSSREGSDGDSEIDWDEMQQEMERSASLPRWRLRAATHARPPARTHARAHMYTDAHTLHPTMGACWLRCSDSRFSSLLDMFLILFAISIAHVHSRTHTWCSLRQRLNTVASSAESRLAALRVQSATRDA